MDAVTPPVLSLLALFALFGCEKTPEVSNSAGSTGGDPGVGGSSNPGTTSIGGSSSGGESSVGGNSATTGGQLATDAGADSGTSACGSLVIEDGFVDAKASDPGIRYVGRFDFSKVDAPRMAFPAATIETQFVGDAIDIRLQETASGGVTATAYYDVSVDSQAPTKLMTCVERGVYPLARNLSSGTHTVRISKRTEASVGTATFLGFRVRPDTNLSRPAAPTRLLEFVGDSITCGYGNELSTTDPDSYKFTSTNENALLAYGAVTASALVADYVAVAISGRGMVRNYEGFSALTGPQYYELTGAESDWPAWDHSRYSPDVIVVNLGTNDFSPGLDTDQYAAMRENFRQTYAQFLGRLREAHPMATLIAAVGPMMSDSYPDGYLALMSIESDIKGVVKAATAAGDSNTFFFEFAEQSSPYGEDWHPTIDTHQKMADVLVPFIEQKKGW
jgi:lysophospholipase L1-like esterase